MKKTITTDMIAPYAGNGSIVTLISPASTPDGKNNHQSETYLACLAKFKDPLGVKKDGIESFTLEKDVTGKLQLRLRCKCCVRTRQALILRSPHKNSYGTTTVEIPIGMPSRYCDIVIALDAIEKYECTVDHFHVETKRERVTISATPQIKRRWQEIEEQFPVNTKESRNGHVAHK